jgi:hypothetical protein
MDSTYDNLDDLAKKLDKRKPVFVTADGQIEDAEKLGQQDQDEHKPRTQLKATTWFQAVWL